MAKNLTTKEVQEQAGRTGALINGRVTHADYNTGLINPDIALVVYGYPAPQGSKKHIGGGRLVETSKALAPWRNAIRQEVKKAILAKGPDWDGPIEEPVLIEVVFTFPHSAASKKRGDMYYQNMPDLDKLQRAVGDAISPTPLKRGVTTGLSKADADKLKAEAKQYCILGDDSNIVAWHSKKVYEEATTDALKFPGVAIEVWRLSSLHKAQEQLREGKPLT